MFNSSSIVALAGNIDYMMSIEDNFFSIGITDIPYGIDVGNMSFVKEKNTTVRQKNGTKLNPNKNKKMKPADWDSKVPDQIWFDEFCRVTKEQIFFGVEYVDYKNIGSGRIKWDKCVPKDLSFKGYELAYCSFIDYTHDLKYLYSGMMQGKSILELTTQQGNKKLNEKRIHPTQKPIILWDIILQFCIKKGIDISHIFDSNCGLCSLAISADKLNSMFTGCDINENYINESKKRLGYHSQILKLF